MSEKNPSPVFSFDLNERRIDVKMSFGLLNVIVSLFDSPADLLNLDNRPDVIHDVINELLATRDQYGAVVSTPSLFDLDPQVGTQLYNWAMEHVSDFFINRLSQKEKLVAAIQSTTPPLGQNG